MQKSPSWEADSCSASQKIPHLLLNPNVHYCVDKHPPPVPTLSQMTPVQPLAMFPQYPFLMLSSHLHLDLPSGLFSPGYPTKILYAFLISATHATRPTHLIILDMIILIMYGEECKLRRSSLCNFLQPTVTPFLLGPMTCIRENQSLIWFNVQN
jgi:hypothetical protein